MTSLCLLFALLAWGDDASSPPSLRAQAVDFDDETTPVPVPEPTPLALQYHRTGNVLWAFARCWDMAVPLVLLLTGASARLRDLANRLGRRWYFSVALYLVFFSLLIALADLPLRYYAGFVRQHAYDLSHQTFAKWSSDWIKSIGVELIGVALFAWVPFALIRWLPRVWWLVLSGLAIPFMAFVALIAPVWIDPLFNDYGPMKNRALEAKILAMAEQAGISGSRVFEVNKSVDTKTANAYVKGVLGTHRIVLWDTLLNDFDEREVLVVMGHEMGHYVLHHIEWGLALSSLILVASLFWTDRAGRWLIRRFHERFGFNSLADVAATPLLVVLIGLSTIVLGPIGLAYSRYHEHEADRFALELTHMNRSGARTFAHFQTENLGIPYPGLLYKMWRSTHPSAGDRITFFNEYHPWRDSSKSAD